MPASTAQCRRVPSSRILVAFCCSPWSVAVRPPQTAPATPSKDAQSRRAAPLPLIAHICKASGTAGPPPIWKNRRISTLRSRTSVLRCRAAEVQQLGRIQSGRRALAERRSQSNLRVERRSGNSSGGPDHLGCRTLTCRERAAGRKENRHCAGPRCWSNRTATGSLPTSMYRPQPSHRNNNRRCKEGSARFSATADS